MRLECSPLGVPQLKHCLAVHCSQSTGPLLLVSREDRKGRVAEIRLGSMKALGGAQQASLFSGQAGSSPAARGSTCSGSEHGPNLGLNSHTKHSYSSTVIPASNCFREKPRPWKESLNTIRWKWWRSNQDFPDVKLALIFLKRQSFTPTCSAAATFQRQGKKSDWTAIRHYPSQTNATGTS